MTIIFIAVHQANARSFSILYLRLEALSEKVLIQRFYDLSLSINPLRDFNDMMEERIRFLNIQRKEIRPLLISDVEQILISLGNQKQRFCPFSFKKCVRPLCCRQAQFQRRKRLAR